MRSCLVVISATLAIFASAAGAQDAIVKLKDGRPRLCTADGASCVELTTQLHLDVGGYAYRPDSAATVPQSVRDGAAARRARIGIKGVIADDLDFGLIGDGAGPPDGLGNLNRAFLVYNGFKKAANLALEGGFINVPYTLDQSTSSNAITFLERAAPNAIATNLNAGDSRAAGGFHVNGANWWAGGYVTGPGADQAFVRDLQPPLGLTARGVVTPINGQVGTVLIGVDFAHLVRPAARSGVPQVTLSDRIEVRVDPGTDRLLSTGAIANAQSATVISAEAAASIGSFYAQGEVFAYRVQRAGFGDSRFAGGYAQMSYVLTGESRSYTSGDGVFGGVKPKTPFDFQGGAGAWEIGARVSYVDLNDASPFAIKGGRLFNTTLGLNWYPSDTVRFMVNYIHGRVERSDALARQIGASYDVIAMRTQIAF